MSVHLCFAWGDLVSQHIFLLVYCSASFRAAAAGAMTLLVGLPALFSLVTAVNGYWGLVFKKKKEKAHDASLQHPNAERLSDNFPIDD